MDEGITKFVGILTAIVGLAILSVILSSKSNTSGVLSSFFSGFSSLISAATSPVSGASSSPLSGILPNLTGSGGAIDNGGF